MNDIYLDTLTYYKPEIDTKLNDERNRVDAELAKRVETADVGVPGGIATLDDLGDVVANQMPYATKAEAFDPNNNTKAMTPQNTHELLNGMYHVYEYASVSNVTIIDSVFKPLVHLVTPYLDAGVYEIKVSTAFLYSAAGNSMFVNLSIDGGSTWEQYRYYVEYADEKFVNTHILPIVHSGGAFDIIMEGRCETTGDVLTVNYANLIVERKK